jgi:hypothetical protein
LEEDILFNFISYKTKTIYMKKLITLIAAFVLVGTSIVSCEKDDSESASNSITIKGTFTAGDKTYENPTFNLGDPSDHIGFIQTNIPVKANRIYVGPKEPFDVGDGNFLNYESYINGDAPGTYESDAYVSVYIPNGKSGIWLYSSNLTSTVTKVDEVGEYIEGYYEGTFYQETKSAGSYTVKGKFKVLRIEYPVLQ